MLTLEDILNSHRTGTAVVMGILNVTPDSFSDGGEFLDPAAAIAQGRRMIEEGAAIIDIGAESTRPGSQRVPPEEQIRRLKPVLPALATAGAIISIDTTSREVGQFAIDSGAKIINDISAGQDEPELMALAGRFSCGYVLMHMLGQPRDMQADPRYDDVVAEVQDFLARRLEAARSAGLPAANCILDPGIGFGKTPQHNLQLLANLRVYRHMEQPLLIGASRKRFIGQVCNLSQPQRRLAGSLAAAIEAYRQGASIFRVHDVGETVQALKLAQAIREQEK